MKTERPKNNLGIVFGLIICAVSIATSIGLLYALFSEPTTLISYWWGIGALVALMLAVCAAYWTLSLTQGRYTIREETFVIEWGRLQERLPLVALQAAVITPINPIAAFRGVRWPGLCVGHGRLTPPHAPLPVSIYTTSTHTDLVLLFAADHAYLISPAEPQQFVQKLLTQRSALINPRR